MNRAQKKRNYIMRVFFPGKDSTENILTWENECQ